MLGRGMPCPPPTTQTHLRWAEPGDQVDDRDAPQGLRPARRLPRGPARHPSTLSSPGPEGWRSVHFVPDPWGQALGPQNRPGPKLQDIEVSCKASHAFYALSDLLPKNKNLGSGMPALCNVMGAEGPDNKEIMAIHELGPTGPGAGGELLTYRGAVGLGLKVSDAPLPAGSAGPGAGSPSPAVGACLKTGPPWTAAHTPGEEGGMVGISWLQVCISEWGATPLRPTTYPSEHLWQRKSRGACRLGINRRTQSLRGQGNPHPVLVSAQPLTGRDGASTQRSVSHSLGLRLPFPVGAATFNQ